MKERGSEMGGGGGGGSCSGKMTSKPVMSSSSQCQAVTRQKQRRRQTEKAESREVTSPAVILHMNRGRETAVLTRERGRGMEGERGQLEVILNNSQCRDRQGVDRKDGGVSLSRCCWLNYI